MGNRVSFLQPAPNDYCLCNDLHKLNMLEHFNQKRRKGVKEMELINREEFEREERIKILRLCKDDMYYHLLKPYKYTRHSEFNEKEQKEVFTYQCKYENCNKMFAKAWNLLDHVRMHEGIKPYQCEFCKRCFTQKCNFRKHKKRHLEARLEDRKKFKCDICNKGFTELYNQKVRISDETNYQFWAQPKW